ncbi:sugar kinase [Aestuariirhabdus sp. Z084]|uniref:sugar kinase n=1 Tax=Aestuariirhabdus haliotis TaxID=2918751 RepID=UPI00201B398B|nr:sugar kinase [Aestuariirhabdus haliotis]MCL6415109.1 sugar kinase [Aestuariirhabdus haliotis]MCL6419041.1 sugar kinase [Aestuariirhabdus haliotis]
MSKHAKKIACIGECMIEMSPAGPGLFKQGFAGDTFNTAVYFKRQFGAAFDVEYVTALGDDPLSQAMIDQFDREQISTDLVRIIPDKQPGLYVIENDAQGERFFHYWRKQSAACSTFKGLTAYNIYKLFEPFDLIYLSGISLAILDNQQRTNLLAALHRLKKTTTIAFDPNYRPALWPSKEVCAITFQAMAENCSIVLSTFEDDQAIWNDPEPVHAINRWRDWGAEEVVIKNGAQGCTLLANDILAEAPVPRAIAPVDTTGAGDSFCAGYCGARLLGNDYVQAAELGHNIAAQVIQHPGGVIHSDRWTAVSEPYGQVSNGA